LKPFARQAEEALGRPGRERHTRSGPATMRQGLDRKPSQAWATKMLTLTMPKNAVTISIITPVLYTPRPGNGMAGRTVKRIQSGANASQCN
jgi:hypothetical protein